MATWDSVPSPFRTTVVALHFTADAPLQEPDQDPAEDGHGHGEVELLEPAETARHGAQKDHHRLLGVFNRCAEPYKTAEAE